MLGKQVSFNFMQEGLLSR